jgi:cbb3-type cytochrome oxidase maturation protein
VDAVNLVGLIILSLALGLAAWLAFLWSVRSGQYEDPEGPKYRMLDDEDEPGPTKPAETRAPARADADPGGDRPRAAGPERPERQPPGRS